MMYDLGVALEQAGEGERARAAFVSFREACPGHPMVPDALHAEAALREIVVNVKRDGTLAVGGAETTLDGLRSIVADAVERNPEQKVSVRGDKDASYGVVARVLDVCKAAGVGEPFLDTVPMN